ncbi:hypothetical protein [Haloferula sargassicola]|uniref:hypothetical protein n=1 Tax=Haloferula sargassicola TaxID=490096 RepID=UPI0033659538
MMKPSAIVFAALVAIVFGEPKFNGETPIKGVAILTLEFPETKGESRLYKIKSMKTLEPRDAERVRRAFDSPPLKEPELLDVLVDFFAVSVDGELFYVVEMQLRGFAVMPANMNGKNLERVPAESRLLGKLPEIADLLDRNFRDPAKTRPEK